MCVSFIPTASISSASISTFCFSSDRIRFLIKNHTLHRGTFYQFIKILIVWSQFSAAIFNIFRDGFNILLLSYLCKVIFVSNCLLVSIVALFKWLSHLLKFKFMSMTLYFERESRVNGFLRWIWISNVSAWIQILCTSFDKLYPRSIGLVIFGLSYKN